MPDVGEQTVEIRAGGMRCGKTTAWLTARVRQLEEENRRLRQALMGAAYWYRRSGWTGQAIGELACGHGGPLGAPMCKACTNKALDEAMRKETP
ncbi:hypothetical protein [Symbiobacterium terraclitae]|uniref:hypothetical protein n=1 Tax=Symbiobacterium terraclitae TaxID=557451 RepID=UPI0035B51EF8